MEVHEKIRFLRSFKGWSQEDMASKLGISLNSYAKIERGETDVNLSRLQQISETLNIKLSDLVGLNEKNVISIIGSYNKSYNIDNPLSIHVYPSESSYQQELEKLRLVNEEQRKEIVYLKEIIALLKKEEK